MSRAARCGGTINEPLQLGRLASHLVPAQHRWTCAVPTQMHEPSLRPDTHVTRPSTHQLLLRFFQRLVDHHDLVHLRVCAPSDSRKTWNHPRSHVHTYVHTHTHTQTAQHSTAHHSTCSNAHACTNKQTHTNTDISRQRRHKNAHNPITRARPHLGWLLILANHTV